MSELLIGNLQANVPRELADEQFEPLLAAAGLRIERIVSLGHVTEPGQWYDQPQSEFVLLASGRATLEIEGRPDVELVPGAYINLPAHCRHRVKSTDLKQPTIWLAIHYG